tara:strand:- start:1950 stop:2675 length:726 start_codon:yes stop_codon:yes gene_type:complete
MAKLTHRLKRAWYRHTIRNIPQLSFSQERLKEEGYSSQYGQDKYINETFFKGKENGVFVDIGANDGVSLSNTVFFEKVLKWNGLAIEPLPSAFEKLQANRECTAVNACVNDVDGEVSFMAVDGYAEMLSGIIDRYDDRHIARIKRENEKHGGSATQITVPGYRLSTLLRDTPFKVIDYMNIDTEGSEFDILQSIDFETIRIDIITVENNYYDGRIRRYLDKCGYDLVAKVGDEIYSRRESM